MRENYTHAITATLATSTRMHEYVEAVVPLLSALCSETIINLLQRVVIPPCGFRLKLAPLRKLVQLMPATKNNRFVSAGLPKTRLLSGGNVIYY